MDEAALHSALLGEYRILGVLGRGGMGTVYLAEQHGPDRRVALKVLHGGALDDPESRALFRREIRALALLEHPGIASLYTTGTTGDGVPFFAMELVEGQALDDWWRGRGGPSATSSEEIRRRIDVFLQICDAVAYAHAKGVIHRDLKPSNVFVRERDGEDEVKVLDFGLARISDAEGGVRSRVTERGTLRGTVPYMSPEQLAGDSDAVDARSDVYALGVLLYELLSGAHPHRAEDLSSFELPGRILREPARPISRSWRGKRKIDADLATIVMKALEREPVRRYQTVQALEDDLRRWRTGQPIAARPASTAYQLHKMIQRNRLGFGLVALGLLVVIGGAIGLAVLASHLAAERDRANREAELARTSAQAFSRVLFRSLPSEGLARLDDPEAVITIVNEIVGKWEGDPNGEIDLLRTAGLAVFESGLFEAGIRFVERALEIEKETSPLWSTRGTAMVLGEMYQRAGRPTEAEELFRKIVDDLRSWPEPLPPRTIGYSLENLGCALRDLGRLAEAQGLLEEALRLYAGEPVPSPVLLGSVHDSLGNLFLERGDLVRAEEELRLSLRIRDGDSAANHPQFLQSLHDLGRTLLRRGKLDEAEPMLRRALAGREAKLGSTHPDTAATLAALAELETARGHLVAARENLDRVARIYDQRLPKSHPRALAVREAIERLDSGAAPD